MADTNTHNVQINGTSPKEDVLAAVNGMWSVTTKNDWTVMHLSDRLEYWNIVATKAGSYMLPRKVDKVTMAKIFYTDGTTAGQIINLNTEVLYVAKPCMIEVTIVNL